MLAVRVNIIRYTDASFPGWVECTLVDALGHEHTFMDKVPAVTASHLDAASIYPQQGIIACVVLGSSKSDDGRQIVHIDTQTRGILSTAGRSQFDVFSEQLVARAADA